MPKTNRGHEYGIDRWRNICLVPEARLARMLELAAIVARWVPEDGSVTTRRDCQTARLKCQAQDPRKTLASDPTGQWLCDAKTAPMFFSTFSNMQTLLGPCLNTVR